MSIRCPGSPDTAGGGSAGGGPARLSRPGSAAGAVRIRNRGPVGGGQMPDIRGQRREYPVF
ncbi:hypothetical protein CEB3_c50710 [Peptococcaceae bacterium CEB3]|nr:hypothetical protein CEB3_c50710 [Peptococcaceae bacterium CEB3]